MDTEESVSQNEPSEAQADREKNVAELTSHHTPVDQSESNQKNMKQVEVDVELQDLKENEAVEISAAVASEEVMEESISMEISDGQEVELMDTNEIETASEETMTVTTETTEMTSEMKDGGEDEAEETNTIVPVIEKGGKLSCCYW